MSAVRRRKRAIQPPVEPKHPSIRGPSSVPTTSPPSSSPLPIGKSDFLGRALWVCLALIVAIVVVYAPVRQYGFVSLDDPQYVSENPNVLGGLTWPGVSWA